MIIETWEENGKILGEITEGIRVEFSILSVSFFVSLGIVNPLEQHAELACQLADRPVRLVKQNQQRYIFEA